MEYKFTGAEFKPETSGENQMKTLNLEQMKTVVGGTFCAPKPVCKPAPACCSKCS